jgi:hypothetical protein
MHCGRVGAASARTDSGGADVARAGTMGGVGALGADATGGAMDGAIGGATDDTTECHDRGMTLA